MMLAGLHPSRREQSSIRVSWAAFLGAREGPRLRFSNLPDGSRLSFVQEGFYVGSLLAPSSMQRKAEALRIATFREPLPAQPVDATRFQSVDPIVLFEETC